jgi:hypothetical protein
VSAAPDFASAVAGYRAWQLAPGGFLFPLALPAAPPWEPGVNRARCFAGGRHGAHEAPGPDCRCGLHALHNPGDGRLKLGHPVIGAIAAWGEIEVYAEGFRAEYASVIALVHQQSCSTGPPARVREAARRYGARLVSLSALEAEAGEFALPLPNEALPKRRVELARFRYLATAAFHAKQHPVGRTPVVPLWYRMHRPICPDRPRPWTHRKRRTLRDI